MDRDRADARLIADGALARLRERMGQQELFLLASVVYFVDKGYRRVLLHPSYLALVGALEDSIREVKSMEPKDYSRQERYLLGLSLRVVNSALCRETGAKMARSRPTTSTGRS